MKLKMSIPFTLLTLLAIAITLYKYYYIYQSNDALDLMKDPFINREIKLFKKRGLQTEVFGANGTVEWFDQYMMDGMRDESVPSAAIVVVYEGKVLFSNIYELDENKEVLNFRNDAGKMTVSPSETLFRTASVTKTFVAMAMLQLVEEGAISLTDLANDYLPYDMQLPNDQGDIDIIGLFNHIGGLDETLINFFAYNNKIEKLMPLEKFIKKTMPEQVRPVNVVRSYSNFGVTVAGYIIQNISGMDFNEYVTKNMLQKMNMNHSTTDQSSANWENLAPNTDPVADILNPYPAGSLFTTVDDMANYLLTLLNNGVFNGNILLSPETVNDILLNPLFSRLAYEPIGMGLSWYSTYFGDTISMGHGGDLPGFASHALIVKEKNLGIWVSAGAGAASLRNNLVGSVIDQFFPIQRNENISSTVEAAAPTMDYLPARIPRNTFQRFMFAFLTFPMPVVNEGDYLSISKTLKFYPVNSEPRLYVAGDQGLDTYPYAFYDNSSSWNYLTFQSPIRGLEKADFTYNFFFIVVILGVYEILSLVLLIVFGSLMGCCCSKKETEFQYEFLNEYDKTVYVKSVTLGTIIVSFITCEITLLLYFIGTPAAMYSNTGLVTIASFLPIALILLIIMEIGLLLFAITEKALNIPQTIVFILNMLNTAFFIYICEINNLIL